MLPIVYYWDERKTGGESVWYLYLEMPMATVNDPKVRCDLTFEVDIIWKLAGYKGDEDQISSVELSEKLGKAVSERQILEVIVEGARETGLPIRRLKEIVQSWIDRKGFSSFVRPNVEVRLGSLNPHTKSYAFHPKSHPLHRDVHLVKTTIELPFYIDLGVAKKTEELSDDFLKVAAASIFTDVETTFLQTINSVVKDFVENTVLPRLRTLYEPLETRLERGMWDDVLLTLNMRQASEESWINTFSYKVFSSRLGPFTTEMKDYWDNILRTKPSSFLTVFFFFRTEGTEDTSRIFLFLQEYFDKVREDREE